jgi:pimeloyl-ACP methyl ester carboxylesterase
MPTLDREGVRMSYEVHGQGPVILLTHGYAASMRMWDSQIEALGRSHRLIIWDMRGHGESGSPEDPDCYSQEATLEDMEALLHACGAERAVIGGLSLGGYMSLAFHRMRPEKVRALMLFDTGPGFRNPEAREGWNRYAEDTARSLEEKGLSALRDSPEVAASKHHSVGGLIQAARGILTQRDAAVIDSLEKIAVPTLIVVGAEDEPFLKPTDYMAAKIPNAVKKVLPAAGHAVNLDQPDVFNDVVLSFLDKLPNPS